VVEDKSWVDYYAVAHIKAASDRHVVNAGFPGSSGDVASGSGAYDTLDDDELLAPPRSKSVNRKAVISDDDYSSDDDRVLLLDATLFLYIEVAYVDL
jgi:hypothetical protein